MKKNTVVVLVPIIAEQPSELEKISLQQTLSILYKYPLLFQAPLHLDATWYTDFCKSKGKEDVDVIRFDWKGYEAYSMLHTSPCFFLALEKYEYLLTCHMDAFVFRDELEYWCSLGYDFIGSVIYQTTFKVDHELLKKMLTYNRPEYFGNGGFSLRKIDTFYTITSRFKSYLKFYHWQRRLRHRGFYDDLFHATHYPKLSVTYKPAPKHLAEKFGANFIVFDEADLPFSNTDIDSLPFGIHGWIKNHQEYWKPCIKHYGYEW